MPTRLADKPGLQIGEPDVVRPAIRADLDPVRATVVGADQHVADAGDARLAEGDLLAVGHAPSKPRENRLANYQWLGDWVGGQLQAVAGGTRVRRFGRTLPLS